MNQDKRLTGKIDPARIRHLSVPRADTALLTAYRELGEASGVISDAMDRLGIPGVIGASTLVPTLTGKVMVGTALTVRNALQRGNEYEAARAVVNKMAEFEAHNLAQVDDVLVIQGVEGISNMGGISAQLGQRHGEVGAIVMGGVRDVAHSRSLGYPVWASEITPRTGKWRIETVEINGDVDIAGVRVSCGDIVFADDTGVCFIPTARAQEILAMAQKTVADEKRKCAAVDAGVHIADLPKSD
ncbi:MAG: RraA family protein [Comamonadaceae bacterium]|nr:MAG: RraA family protein [Comamonadaceae bacterium]